MAKNVGDVFLRHSV